jgi:hypothetical protein
VATVDPGFFENVFHLQIKKRLICVDTFMNTVRLNQVRQIDRLHENSLAGFRVNDSPQVNKAQGLDQQPFMLFPLP